MVDIATPVNVLIEITSGRNLLIGDITSSDPYVVAVFAKKKEEIHRTKHIAKT